MFSCPPSVLYEQDAEIIRLVAIKARGTKQEEPEMEEETDG